MDYWISPQVSRKTIFVNKLVALRITMQCAMNRHWGIHSYTHMTKYGVVGYWLRAVHISHHNNLNASLFRCSSIFGYSVRHLSTSTMFTGTPVGHDGEQQPHITHYNKIHWFLVPCSNGLSISVWILCRLLLPALLPPCQKSCHVT